MKTNLLDKAPLTPGACEWCGSLCELEDACCSLSCEAQMARLEAVQGQAVVRALKTWRLARNNAARQEMLAVAAPMVDRFLRSDQRRRERLGAERRAAKTQADAQ